MLFLMHLISKMRSASDEGGRAAIVLNGSPLFTGGAGSGESNIRTWVLECDLLEAIIALPTDMFYNTGIATYVWVLSTKKSAERTGRVQLIDGTKLFRKMRKGLGSKRNELGPDDSPSLHRPRHARQPWAARPGGASRDSLSPTTLRRIEQTAGKLRTFGALPTPCPGGEGPRSPPGEGIGAICPGCQVRNVPL